MAQVVARLEDRLLADVDELVDRHRRGRVGAQIVEAYRRLPQTAEEVAGLDEATRALVGEEPW